MKCFVTCLIYPHVLYSVYYLTNYKYRNQVVLQKRDGLGGGWPCQGPLPRVHSQVSTVRWSLVQFFYLIQQVPCRRGVISVIEENRVRSGAADDRTMSIVRRQQRRVLRHQDYLPSTHVHQSHIGSIVREEELACVVPLGLDGVFWSCKLNAQGDEPHKLAGA